MMSENRYSIWCAVLVAGATFLMLVGAAAGNQGAPTEKELKLISVLESDAPAAEKAITCKRLAIYGSQEAVPALAPLLADERLSSWARTALEAIPGPAVDGALRDAVGKVKGRLLVGVINSIGVRRDAGAVGVLAEELKDADAEVASAAAVALGCIAGDQAAAVLGQALADASPAVRPAVAEGCVRCAEKYLADGKSAQARSLYDAVCVADVPKQRILDATRGAILARGSDGVSFLVEQLTSSDKGRLGIGLRTARELPGRDVTEALAAEMNELSPDRQPLLLLAIADRTDAAVLPVVLQAAESGSNELRAAAADVLVRLGNVSSVPALLKAATDSDETLAQTARTTLAKLPGKDIDKDLLDRLPEATGTTRQALIEVTGRRQIGEALPAIMQSLEDADAGVRTAAIQAVGILGQGNQVPDLVALAQKNQNPGERGDIEKALLAVSGRAGAGCVQSLMPLMQSDDATLRKLGLRTMAIVGGPEGLAAVKAAIDDKDESVQDEAVRTLSTWPNNWPDDAAAADVLLTLAKSGKKMSHQVLGLQGYLQYVRRTKSLDGNAKVAKISEVLGLAQRPEEKRLAIAVVSDARTGSALELLTTLTSDSAVSQEACSAIVNIAGRNLRDASKDQRRNALQAAAEKAKDAGTKRRAEELLKGL